MLDRVFDEVLRSRSPDFPFCLCWANENWTRAWDAGEHEILLKQDYDVNEREEHVLYLVDAFRDERYVRVDGRPLFLLYRVQALPDAEGFIDRLRRVSIDAGTGDPYIVKFDTHGRFDDPAEHHCDAAAQFLPHGVGEKVPTITVPDAAPGNAVYDYAEVAQTFLHEPEPSWIRHECVFPGWDNTPRRGDGRSLVVANGSPEAYEAWLRAVYERAGERGGMVFLNAWNEWAEGAHLEPDERDGLAYLRATATGGARARATGRADGVARQHGGGAPRPALLRPVRRPLRPLREDAAPPHRERGDVAASPGRVRDGAEGRGGARAHGAPPRAGRGARGPPRGARTRRVGLNPEFSGRGSGRSARGRSCLPFQGPGGTFPPEEGGDLGWGRH